MLLCWEQIEPTQPQVPPPAPPKHKPRGNTEIQIILTTVFLDYASNLTANHQGLLLVNMCFDAFA